MSRPPHHSYKFGRYLLTVADEGIRVYSDGYLQTLALPLAKALRMLVENQGEFISKDRLYKCMEVGGGMESVVQKAIHELRQFLNDTSNVSRFIETERGKGYRFIHEVKFVEDGAANAHPGEEAETDPTDKEQSKEGEGEGGTQQGSGDEVRNQAEGEEPQTTEELIAQLAANAPNDGMETFEAWVLGPGRVITMILIACVSLTVALSVVGTYKNWEWTKLFVTSAQAVVLIIAILYPMRWLKGFLPVAENDRRLRAIIKVSAGYDDLQEWNEASYIATRSLKRYTLYWRGILFTWLLLYAFLTVLAHPDLNFNCPMDSSQYCVGSFKDLDFVVRDLQNAEPRAVPAYLLEQLSPNTRQELRGYDRSSPRAEKLQRALVHEFNDLLKDPYLPRLAAEMGHEVQNEVKNRRSNSLAAANRLILDKSYPDNLHGVTTENWGYVLSIFTTLCNNFSSLMIILCFNVLNKPSEIKQGDKSISDTALSIGAALVVIISLAEFIIAPPNSIDQYYLLKWWSWASGIAGGIAMALYVGRLQSKFLGPRAWLLIALYSYTAIQSLFIFLEARQTAAIILIDLALALKCLLFLYMAWLFQSGRLLFYLVRVRRTYKEVKTEWGIFRNLLEKKS